MIRVVYTYLFSLILVTSIVLPTYISITKFSCEISLEIDMEEDSEESEITKDTEAKITHTTQNLSTYSKIRIQNSIIYISTSYNSIFKKLDSPPPEFYS
ncbi:hypothetical protein [Tenacibaculum jejuense]|uniref:Uncharacterized protein n=1 Tax=Tenacibaculum jejuense TaxID=584609 RepID=A0A238UEB9_9FLAO|nr:hypothetical protein [Tenacibaculum jejuense]SNR17395.1 protein of unknown function [Tenacibaculum jejuense]